jgi:carboxyl-terminal processing protease
VPEAHEPHVPRQARRGLQHQPGRGETGVRQGEAAGVRPDSVIEAGVLPLALRFARAKRSIAVFTEALGAQRHHGRTALLVNEHSASAAEMVAAFAKESGLATVVGTKTPGRLVATSGFKVGFGYRVALPVAAYYTWNGTNLEGRGVAPDMEEGVSCDALWRGEDNQLRQAQAQVRD